MIIMDKEILNNRKKKIFTDEELNQLEKKDLIRIILQQQEHVKNLKNIITKISNNKCDNKIIKQSKKEFHFDKYPKQHIALHVLYLGWYYQGFVVQEDTNETVEYHLMESLLKAKLIENRENSNYHRCGRTDKGVSSYGQVISVTVRKNLEGSCLNYTKILNKLLPDFIRIISWAPVNEDFSSRFNCTSRTYLYFFPKSILNIEAMNKAASYLVSVHDFRNLCKMDVGNGVTCFIRAMNKAASYLVGVHDFRNLCKMDVGNGVTCFIREIFFSKISKATQQDEDNEYTMYQLEIRASSFLWHQIRCIVAILLLVGQNLEEPTIVEDLLKTDTHPRKPQYQMAVPLGLNLNHCEFKNYNLKWTFDSDDVQLVISKFQQIWTSFALQTQHIKFMLDEMKKLDNSSNVHDFIFAILRKESKNYKSLLNRETCYSLEEKLECYAKKRKVDFKS